MWTVLDCCEHFDSIWIDLLWARIFQSNLCLDWYCTHCIHRCAFHSQGRIPPFWGLAAWTSCRLPKKDSGNGFYFRWLEYQSRNTQSNEDARHDNDVTESTGMTHWWRHWINRYDTSVTSLNEIGRMRQWRHWINRYDRRMRSLNERVWCDNNVTELTGIWCDYDVTEVTGMIRGWRRWMNRYDATMTSPNEQVHDTIMTSLN